MELATISNGMAFVLVALAVPVPQAESAVVLTDHDFDLAAVTLVKRVAASTSQVSPRLTKPRHSREEIAGEPWTPPHKSWGISDHGPVLQIGALGTKDKRMPDLAHVALDWDF